MQCGGQPMPAFDPAALSRSSISAVSGRRGSDRKVAAGSARRSVRSRPARHAGDVPDSVFYVATHPDDALLFRGEGYFTDLHSPGVTTITIVPSAGDAGRTDGWWEAREAGCVESIVGALSPGKVTAGPVTVNGHPIFRYGAAGWSAYFLRLPDGNTDGAGFPSTGGRTLGKLQAGTIPTLTAVDGSSTYNGWN